MNLITLKTEPFKQEYIAHIPITRVFKAITLWPSAFKFWAPVKQPEPFADEEWFVWVWAGVTFDAEFMYLEFGTTAYDMISRLAMANIIFPDGSYNLDFLKTYKLIKEEEYGSDRPKREFSRNRRDSEGSSH